jgi:hypothetical protein
METYLIVTAIGAGLAALGVAGVIWAVCHGPVRQPRNPGSAGVRRRRPRSHEGSVVTGPAVQPYLELFRYDRRIAREGASHFLKNAHHMKSRSDVRYAD